MKTNFTGTLTLLRLALRRDRFKLPAWLIGITLMLGLITATYGALSIQELESVTAMRVATPGVRLFDAPVSGVSLGQFTMMRLAIMTAVFFALMSTQAVVRHTRYNEETGCAEMIGSTVVGRYASLSAALLVGVGANIVLAVCTALALMANGLPAAGSFAAGASFGATGIVFTGIAAVTAQLSESARGAGGFSMAVIAFAFLVNAIGGVLGETTATGLGFTSAWPVWLSPVGWSTQMQAFDQNNWWILAPFAALFIALASGAFFLINRRDVGAGLLPGRRGPAAASRSLLSPLGLAWRLQRGVLLGWALPILVFGAVFGAISDEFGVTLEGIEMAEPLSISAETVLFTMIGLTAMIIAIYTVQALLRMRTEEAAGTLEPVLATAVSRTRWMAGHIVCSTLGTVALLLLFALGIALAAGSYAGETVDFCIAALFHASAVLALGGFTVMVFGLWPRGASTLAWAVILFSLVAGPLFGPLLDLPQFVQNLSPFTHIHVLPAEVTATPIAVLLAVTAALFAAGLIAFRQRNLSL